MIITRSPLRISLGGGGTDLASYYGEHGGFLIAGAIDKYIYITLHETFIQELIIKYSKLERVASASQIEVVIHPQSVIHSMVAYADGSVLAQLGNPDMRTPIAHALAYPERIDSGVDAIDLARIGQLEFRQPDRVRFPCLQLAFDALQVGGSAPAVLNAANEVAVQAFLDNQISFSKISTLIAETLSRVPAASVDTLESLLAQDSKARDQARALLQ